MASHQLAEDTAFTPAVDGDLFTATTAGPPSLQLDVVWTGASVRCLLLPEEQEQEQEVGSSESVLPAAAGSAPAAAAATLDVLGLHFNTTWAYDAQRASTQSTTLLDFTSVELVVAPDCATDGADIVRITGDDEGNVRPDSPQRSICKLVALTDSTCSVVGEVCRVPYLGAHYNQFRLRSVDVRVLGALRHEVSQSVVGTACTVVDAARTAWSVLRGGDKHGNNNSADRTQETVVDPSIDVADGDDDDDSQASVPVPAPVSYTHLTLPTNREV